jgi:hypothetical protein
MGKKPPINLIAIIIIEKKEKDPFVGYFNSKVEGQKEVV